MKKNIFILSFLAIALFSCKKEATIETTEAQEAAATAESDVVYSTIGEGSKIAWRGFKIVDNAEQGHFGKVSIKEIKLSANAGKLVSGTLVADVTTIDSEDLNSDPENKAKLDGHLKANDFFDVEKYPTASFEITEVKESTENKDFNSVISGNLSIKDKKLNITVLANVEVTDEQISVKTEEFAVNRKDFGVKVEGITGAILKENFNLQVDVVAKK